jgi:predicted ATPase
VIRTPDDRLRVFVSSTLAELAEERRAVARAISALRLTPVMFESGARPYEPRDVYQAYLAQSDIFIGLYWQRYGQVDADTGQSGLDEEFDLSGALPRLLYVKVPAPDREPRLAELVSRIREEASYRRFRTPTELGRLVRDDLATLLSERFVVARTSPPTTGEPDPLPAAVTSLVGRDQAIDEVVALIARDGARLVTLIGPSGVGKTRLALAVGERLRDRFDAGTVFVPLADVTDSEVVLAEISRVVGTAPAGADSPLDSLAERLGDGRWLLVLDNLERVVQAARDLDTLLARCGGVAILGTSVTALQILAEHEYSVPPLPLPPERGAATLDELAASPAVALFTDRARAVRHDFALTEGNAPAVVDITRRLEGLPLAIELAAARSRLLAPDALLQRLGPSLDALGTGMVDHPQRHRTLRATVEWSVSLLDDDERSLLETAAVFDDGWTVDAAAEVAGLDEDQALDLTDALARHSLIYVDVNDHGPRPRMLDTICEFVSERLAARPDVAEIQRRHADYYRALAEQADRPLRDLTGTEWAGRLEPEAANLAAAVRWYLAHDRAPLPHLFRVLAPFRVLWPFWGLGESATREARSWIEELRPTAKSLDAQQRAEVLWAAALTALEVSDTAVALAAREYLAPLVDTIDDPYLQAVSELVLSWTSSLVGDIDGARLEASRSLDRLRGQDEPLWTGLVLVTLGGLETVGGRHDDALRHLTEMRELAQRFENPWLSATSSVTLGSLAVAQGRLDEARGLLDEGLQLGVAWHSTHILAMTLLVFATLAVVEGEPERAALLMGAADGLRRRAGLRVWTSLRGEDRLADPIREALGNEAFDRAFAAGSRLSERDALAAARDGAA